MLVIVVTVAVIYLKRRRRRLARDDASEKIDILESPRQRPLVLPYIYPDEDTGHISPTPSPSSAESHQSQWRTPGTTPGGTGVEEVSALLLAMTPRTPHLPGRPSAPSEDLTEPTAVSVPLANAPTHSSAKAREAAADARMYAVNAAASDIVSTVGAPSEAAPELHDEGDSGVDPASSSVSRSTTRTRDVVGLREELEKLRREVRQIRADQSPPAYVSD